ncbi:hypothetical protein F442_01855 [Phytophthora nicotianae P10297]|uniref:Uncharacterized protein n=1 Tax=Phytophthora nicotianae P10297 TaxID=1317064 RepID=W3A114_PHYNI|nr:hypothetical protein F442_01855 [Phytophthora nicotianae P10297]
MYDVAIPRAGRNTRQRQACVHDSAAGWCCVARNECVLIVQVVALVSSPLAMLASSWTGVATTTWSSVRWIFKLTSSKDLRGTAKTGIVSSPSPRATNNCAKFKLEAAEAIHPLVLLEPRRHNV